MITYARYVEVTGDSVTASARVEDAIEEASQDLAEVLDRPLAFGEFTETLYPDRHGRLWPKAVPIFEVADGYEIDGLAVVGSAPFGSPLAWVGHVSTVSLTYTGGWDDARDPDPDAPDLPQCIQRDIAWAAYKITHPNEGIAEVPAGVTSARLGDAALTWGVGGAPGAGDHSRSWWSKRTRSYRWTGPLGVPV